MLADVTISGADLAAWGLPTGLLGGLGLLFRRYFLDGLKRLRFLMGVVMIFLKSMKNSKPFFDSIQHEEMSPIGRKIFTACRDIFQRIALLAEECESIPERGDIISDELINVLREMIDESKNHKKLIVPAPDSKKSP